MLKFEPRITLGEILLIAGLIVSSYLFFFKGGRWIGTLETKFEDVQIKLIDLKNEQTNETTQIQTIKERVAKIEGTVNTIKRNTQ